MENKLDSGLSSKSAKSREPPISAREEIIAAVAADQSPLSNPGTQSTKAYSNSSATTSRLRIVEARAAVAAAELERKRLEIEQEKISVEKALIDARLREEIALIDSERGSRASTHRQQTESDSCQVQQWVDDVARKTEPPRPDESANYALLPDPEQHYQRVPRPPMEPRIAQPAENIPQQLGDLTRAITQAIKCANQTANPKVSGDKLLGRLSARDLGTFSGDAIEWLQFKHAFITTTRIGQYTEEENLARLQRCLKGEAWQAVAARLITVTSAQDVMNTLEMRFGRPELVLNVIILQMKKVPKLTGTRSDLVILSTKVANCVAAIKATECLEYLYNPDLVTEVINKLTETLIYRWLDYYSSLSTHQPRLSALSDFLMREAERLCRAGVVELPQRSAKFPSSIKPVFATVDEVGELSAAVNVVVRNKKEKINKKEGEIKCLYCGLDHWLDQCATFITLDLNEKWTWICDKKLCFKCFSSSHRRERCKSRNRCKKCSRGHHTLLHRDDWTNWTATTPIRRESAEVSHKVASVMTPPETAANVWANANRKGKVYLKVLPVTVHGPAGYYDTLALLDEGSTVTLVDSSVANQVGAVGPSISFNLQGAVGGQSIMESQIVSLTLRTSRGFHTLDRVRTVDELTLPAQAINADILAQYAHLQDLPLDSYNGRPTLLIGQDYWHLIISREVKQGGTNEPVASLTALGWVLHGFVSSITSTQLDFSYHVNHLESDTELHELVKNYFHIDSIGIKTDNHEKMSHEDQRALHILDTKSKKINGKWETGLLWRCDDVNFPDSKGCTMRRLRVIEKLMQDDPTFATDYTKQINNMLDSGYAEVCERPISSHQRIWYLPHFGVRNPNKPGKLRLVHDAKAEIKRISLNTELLTGPDLLNSLVGVLLRFRERKIAVTGDIKEMFMRVKIIPEDQSAQLFLWRPQPNSDVRTYKMTSMIFGAKSSPCTATYILRRNANDFADAYPRAVMAIKRRHYVDDYADSVDSPEEMKQLITDVTKIHASGGFELRDFVSNDLSCLPESSHSESVKLFESKIQRMLGMIWKPRDDVLGFDVRLKKMDEAVVSGKQRPTKREALSVIMSVFDPLGFLCPLMIRAKLLLQDMWRSGLQWDEQIGEKFFKVWRHWLLDLNTCHSFSIPRCYGFNKIDEFELHVFVDASEQAYASVAYLRHKSGQVTFVVAKSRVAPLKLCTIPRLELQAALMGARLGTSIIKEQDLPIVRRIYWTDSQVVWHWIQRGVQPKKTFISNRIIEILDSTKLEEWRWLPGKLNVADEATRATKIPEEDSIWISGPSFLRLPEDEWPKMSPPIPDIDHEAEAVLVIDNVIKGVVLPDIQRFSKWLRLIRASAYVLLFVERLNHRPTEFLNLFRRVEQLWIIKTQRESFKDDISRLTAGHTIERSSRLKNLSAYLDQDGLLRLKGRANAIEGVDKETLTPVILDGRHPYTRLIIKHYHEKAFHGHTETVVNQLREKYWIVHLRPSVRSVDRDCQFCHLRRARPVQPITGDLPPGRLAHQHRPFTHCGLDYFGPMLVTIGRRREKRYGALFTCLTTRAVHIELADSLGTDSAIMAMRRMMARRGCPSVMYSDNGTNFRGANTELKAVLQDINRDKINDFLINKHVDWRFNAPIAPHTGGIWERLIRSVKRCLNVILKEQAPKEEVLQTVLAEIENILNSRPLTHVSVDATDPEALTPNHFLLGGPSDMPWLGNCDGISQKCWRNAQRLADGFWRRWVREYLPTVLKRSAKDDQAKVRVGALVIVVDPSLPRNVWPKGVVEKLFPGPDGIVRIVDVRTVGGILRRHVNKLILV